MGADAADPGGEERARVLDLLKRHGFSTTSFQVLEPGFRYFWDGPEEGEPDACVAYVDTGAAWVAAGAPLAAAARRTAVAERFAEAAARARRRVRLFAVEAALCEGLHFRRTLIGEQPLWDAGAWPETLRGARSLREQLRRAENKGVRARVVGAEEVRGEDGETRRALEALIARWLAARPMAAMGFLVDVHPFSFPEERRYVVAEQEGRPVGFAAAVPIYARGGWFLEDLLRDPEAPNGTAELLVDAMMRLLGEGGGPVTLGLAPLAGPVSGWLRAARDWNPGLYNFHGVRAFKAKFRPAAWEPVYLAYPPRERGAMAVWDSLSAFAGGGMARFGARTLFRGRGDPG